MTTKSPQQNAAMEEMERLDHEMERAEMEAREAEADAQQPAFVEYTRVGYQGMFQNSYGEGFWG